MIPAFFSQFFKQRNQIQLLSSSDKSLWQIPTRSICIRQRSLHTRAYINKHGFTHEIVIANNSGIFSTLAYIRQHRVTDCSKLFFIRTPYWMDEVHNCDEYYKLAWGQPVKALPDFIDVSGLREDHDYDRRNGLLTWQGVIALREKALDQLKSLLKENYYEGTPEVYAEQDGSFNVVIGHRVICKVPKTTFFYCWNKNPIVDHKIGGQYADSIPHTHLYRNTSVPKIVFLLGAGPSTRWALGHFPETQFVLIKYAADTVPTKSDSKEFDNLLAVYHVEDFKNGHLKFSITKSDKTLGITRMGDVRPEVTLLERNNRRLHSAIGQVENENITHQIPRYQLLTSSADEPAWSSPLADLSSSSINGRPIPKGSLMESLSRWAVRTNNAEWARPLPFAFHNDHFHVFFSQVLKKYCPHEKLSHEFFCHLEKDISSLKKIPNNEEIVKLYTQCFINQKGSPHGKCEEQFLRAVESVLKKT